MGVHILSILSFLYLSVLELGKARTQQRDRQTDGRTDIESRLIL